MSDDVRAFVTGDRKLALVFEQLPGRLHQSLLNRIAGTITPELEVRVLASVPRGKTGKLASEIQSRVTDAPEKITGVVFVSAEFAKAGALEYGAHRPAQVKAHSMRLAHAWARTMRTPEIVDVPAYTRTPNIAERSYLRGSEAALAGEVQAQLEDAVTSVVSQV